jgi:hypothetical protein
MKKIALLAVFTGLATQAASTAALAQGTGPRPPQYESPEITAEKKITFRIHAPKAEKVRLSSSDLPGNGPGVEMTRSDKDIWEATVGPVPPGAYRYNFNVDGLAVIDPKNPATSESNSNTWSLVYLPGSETSDTKDVPHGAVAEVTYYSQSLKRFRRMHVYTPPGYEKGEGKYPILYLLHGAMDSDDSWSTVGRSGFILDNLIAAGKAKPMIVVMPAGHTGRLRLGGQPDVRTPGRRIRRRLREGPEALRGEELPRDRRPREPRDRRPVDGRGADAQHRVLASG